MKIKYRVKSMVEVMSNASALLLYPLSFHYY